ncbi:hypothetical protein AAB988_22415 [Burkholderia contaminans]|uniref:hypothetical protein n=1 Tax=Burkholderia contaminans TaxID=488447 RepID=UPI00311268BA
MLAALQAALQVHKQSGRLGRPVARRAAASRLLPKVFEADVAGFLDPQLMDTPPTYVAFMHGVRRRVPMRSKIVALQ